MKKTIAFLTALTALCAMSMRLPAEHGAAAQTKWIDVTFTGTSCAALTSNHNLYVWGEGAYTSGGREASGRLSPTYVETGLGSDYIIDIEGSYALTNSGNVFYISLDSAAPTAIQIMHGVRTLGPGTAIKTDGSLYLLGEIEFDGNGHEVSYGSTSARSATRVTTLSDVIYASRDYGHVAAVTADGSLYTWGYNSVGQSGENGQLGYISNHTEYNEYNQRELTPRRVELSEPVMAAQFDGNLTNLYILTAGGDLYQNIVDSSKGTVSRRHIFSDILKISCASSFYWGNSVLAVTGDHQVYAGGTSDYGFGSGTGTGYTNVYTQIAGKEAVMTAQSSQNFAILDTSGVLWMWGDNTAGLVGNGTKCKDDGKGEYETNSGDVRIPYALYAPTENPYLNASFGDPDGSSEIDTQDAYLVLSEFASAASGETDPDFPSEMADMDGNGIVDTQDAYLLLGYFAYAGAGGSAELTAWLRG